MSVAIFKTDPPSRNFQPGVYGVGAWTSHLHFGYDLVAQLRPRLLVELGVDRGESYFAFCQSAVENATGTTCLGIDTWEGDPHAGGYDETSFAQVTEHNAANYGGFSTLLRTRFEAARGRFADESIDVLHLDGLHTEGAVRADLESWLPKLKPGGILLLHDVGVRQRDFGVWKVWEKMRHAGRSFTFTDGPGLGVWQKPPAEKLPDLLEQLLFAPNELAHYYHERAEEMRERIAREWRDGSIRASPFARQTIIQIFYSTDGQHRAEDSVSTRIGHGAWKDVAIRLPPQAEAAPLRIDFDSALTTIELASLQLREANGQVLFSAGFEQIRVAGDAERQPSERGLLLKITGIDPQLILPPLEAAERPLEVRLRLFVHS